MPTQIRSGSHQDAAQRDAKRQKRALKDMMEAAESATREDKCSFTCGGSIGQQRPITIDFKPPDQEKWADMSVSLPGCPDLSPLVKVCSRATFGQGAKEVLDPTYRKALALDPVSFFIDFDLAAHNVLTAVAKLACPEAAAVTANLYKLNIHQPGDFFKPHLDTPRGDCMVGTIIVCLPAPHSGGQLVVHHHGSQIKYDWGSQLESNPRGINWAFFFSDLEHEILQVQNGQRVTLTYNVFAVPPESPPLSPINLTSTLLGEALSAALNLPQFLPNGGRLGFSCSFLYPHTGQGFGSVMLKGIDAVIMATAQQLHCPAHLEPVWKPGQEFCTKDMEEEDEEWECGCTECAEAAGRVPDSFAIGGKLQVDIGGLVDYEDGIDNAQHLPKEYKARPASSVLWVQKDFKFQLGLVSLGWGNCPSLDIMYSAAAIILDVAPADMRFK